MPVQGEGTGGRWWGLPCGSQRAGKARAKQRKPWPTPALRNGCRSKTKQPGRFGFAAPAVSGLNALPWGWKDVNSSRGQKELPKILKMKMSDEETLAGGRGSILPAQEQRGVLSHSSFAHPTGVRRGLSTRVHKRHIHVCSESQLHFAKLLVYFPAPV